jgi:peptide/nickel transport system substrate-binding protein
MPLRASSCAGAIGYAIVFALLAISCAPTAPVASTATGDAPVHGGRLTTPLITDPVSLDPLRQGDGPLERVVTFQIYESLLAADPVTGEILPGLATFARSVDGRSYRFEISADASWSDGRPIIAEDVVTSVKAFARSKKAIGDGRSGLAFIAGFRDYRMGKATQISGLSADGKILTMTLDRAYCPVLGFLFLNPPLPTHVFGKYLSDIDPSLNADDAPEHLAPPVSSGPFVFKEWRRGEEIVLRANERYWRGRPLLDELAFKLVDPTGVMAALRSGAVQMIWGTPRDGLDVASGLERDPRFRVARTASPGYTFIGWNTKSQTVPAFQDKRVRQALAYGLDVELAARQILQGEATISREHMDRSSWAFTPGLNDYRFDPARAESLIREAGYTKGADGIYQKDGRRLAFTLVTNENNDVRAKLVQLASDQYRAIGVAVTPRLEPFNPLVKRLFDRDPSVEAFVIGWTSAVDPFASEVWHSAGLSPGAISQGLVGFTDPAIDKAIDDARFGPDCSISARKRAYDVLNRSLNDGQPYNFLWTTNTIFAMSTRLHGLVPGSYVPLPDSHVWWLAPQR